MATFFLQRENENGEYVQEESKEFLEKLKITLVELFNHENPKEYPLEVEETGDPGKFRYRVYNIPAGVYKAQFNQNDLPDEYKVNDGDPIAVPDGDRNFIGTNNARSTFVVEIKENADRFYVLVATKKYATVSYDPNGGAWENGTDEVLENKIELNTKGVTVENHPAKPTREGYIFKGWKNTGTGDISQNSTLNINDDKAGQTIEYEAVWEKARITRIIRVNLFVHQETGTEPTANYSTRPSWDKNLLEKLDFTLTEETTDPDAMPRVYKPELVGSGDSHQLIANVPAGNYTLTVTDKGLPEGYQLADGEPLYTGSGMEYINSMKSVLVDVPKGERPIVTFYTLVAHERYITNTFDPNGGEFADGSEDMKTQKVKLLTNGVTFYKINEFTPTRAGYVFKGWLNEANGTTSSADTQFGAKSEYAGETFAYKAVWEKVETPVEPETEKFLLRFKPNGGTWENGSTRNLLILAEKDEVVTIPEAPVREGYKFLYWEGSKYYPGDKYTVTEDHDFVAKWEKVEETEETTAPSTTEKPAASTTEKPAATTAKPADKVASTGVASTALVGVATLVSALGAAYVKRRK